ncbi:site-specific integrase [Parafrankia sp. EUN1f]|uniref:site-specific integrase n=1 Tax=Parafrankia sp. EUN1f TaxID=102897 RepID=UPI0001C43D86|nr:site-specific integrase [Parafrankia sp. EUN1f]EFC86146.1 integrase family protein [Parafrankia sp. EUN1f]
MKGSVYKRPNGWEFRHDIDPDPLTGRRRTTSRGGFATKTEANREMRKSILAHEEGRRVDRSRRTVTEFLDEWIVAVRPSLRPSTWSKYRTYCDSYIKPVIGNTALQELTPVRINLLYAHLLTSGRRHQRTNQGAGLSPGSVAVVHRVLHRALRDAVRWNYLVRNPSDDVERPKLDRRVPTVWTKEQLRTFVDHVRGDRLYALYLVAITTGLRRGALVGLRRHDVDLDAGTLSSSRPRIVVDNKAVDGEHKTDSAYRPLVLDPVTAKALRVHVDRWEQERTEFGFTTDLLFCWPDGTGIHPDTVTDWFQAHAKSAGLPVIRLHDVRHSYATAALKSGVHPKIVSERLGHASVAFTLAYYSHVIPGMDAEAAGAIAGLILGTGETPEDTDVRGSVRTEAETPLIDEEE